MLFLEWETMGWVFGNGEEGMLFCVWGEGSVFTIEKSKVMSIVQ